MVKITSINPAYQSLINRCYKKSRQFCHAINRCHRLDISEDTPRVEKIWNALEVLLESLPKREADNFWNQYNKIHGYTI